MKLTSFGKADPKMENKLTSDINAVLVILNLKTGQRQVT